MANELDNRVKRAMNETRLLVLGAQVLLGSEFTAFFQDRFADLAGTSQMICTVSLGLMITSLGAFVLPTTVHGLAERGYSSSRLLVITNIFTALGLAPLTVAIGLAAYVVLNSAFGLGVGVTGGTALMCLSAFGWFGLELIVGFRGEQLHMKQSPTPLRTRINQLLVEARVIIPGAQALFGFQFIAMLTTGFDGLPQTAKIVHAVALVLIAIDVILLMTPAALHRISFSGEDSELFFRLGSALVATAPLFLAGGIALEFYVVAQRIHIGEGWASAFATIILVALIGGWYAFPLVIRIAPAVHS